MGFFLLSLYLVGNSPSLIIHEHNIVPYEQATACEKAIYYGEKDTHTHHKEHFSKDIEDCWVCDNHTFTPQILFNFSTEIKSFPSYFNPFNFYSEHFISVKLFHFLNRGPPLT